MPERPRVQVPLVVVAQRHLDQSVERTTFLVFPHATVELAADGSRRSFRAAALLDRIFETLMLPEGGAANGSPAVAALEDLALVQRDNAADLPAEVRRLFESKRAVNRVTCVHSDGSSLAGGEVVWLDAGRNGLWLLEPADPGQQRVSLEPAGPGEIARRILALLPERSPGAGVGPS